MRVYDVDGRPVGPERSLDARVASPCTGSAYAAGRFAFAYAHRDPATSRVDSIRVRTVDRDAEVGAPFDFATEGDGRGGTLAGVRDGFVLAVPGEETVIVSLDARGRPISEVRTGPSRRVRLATDASGAVVVVLRVLERRVAGSGREDVWLHESFDVPALLPRGGVTELAVFEPPPAPGFAVVSGTCGEVALGTSTPSLDFVSPGVGGPSLRGFFPDAPLPGALYGGTSVLVIDRDAYTAFSSVPDGALDPRVQIDHWSCLD